MKSLTRTLEQLQKHGATIGVPLPGLPGNPMKENLNGPRYGDDDDNDDNDDTRDTMMTDSHTPGGWFPGSYPMSRKHTDLITGAQSPPPGRRLASSPSPPPNRRNKWG